MVITGNESRVYGYDIEIKVQSFQCYDLGDKRKIKTEAVGDTKKCFSELFRGLKKKKRISVLYPRGVTLKGTR